MRTEISQAKKETNFYLASVEKSQNLQKLKKKKEKKGEVVEEKSWNFAQRPTEDEIQMKRFKDKGMSEKNLQKAKEKSKAIQEKSQSNVSLLAKIFNRDRAQDWDHYLAVFKGQFAQKWNFLHHLLINSKLVWLSFFCRRQNKM